MALNLQLDAVNNAVGIKPTPLATPTAPPTPAPVSTPVGVQAKSPTNNITPPPNTVPANQQNLKDVSQYYANVNGTIYNKARGASGGLDTWDHFLQDAGLPTGTSGTTLKFDTTWTPPSNSTPSATPTPNSSTTPNPAPNSPAGASSTSTGPYSPPNQGTTGVSQGGIIGNLINTANNGSPEVQTRIDDIKKLQESEAQSEANIDSEPIDLSLASGQKGILQRLFAAKSGAAQTALQNALTEQGQGIQATTSAGGLNAPITNPQTGGLVSPSSNTTTGATTSGATNLSSLIGTRTDANGKPNGEYYNTQTGQGFSTPQQLADFVNQQMPGANATATNVFDLLKSGALNGSGGSNGLNPIANVQSIAQQVISGQISPSQAMSMGGTVANWSTLLNQALVQANGGQPIDTSALQAKYDSNQQTQTSQQNQVAAFKSASQQASNLASQFGDLVTKYNLNPNQLNAANGVLQVIAANTSDPRYQSLSNYINDIVATYASILGTGGAATDFKTQLAGSFVNQLASGTSLKQVLASIDQQAQAKIAGVPTPSTTNSTSNSSTLGLF